MGNFKHIMKFHRFEQILHALHFTDIEKAKQNGLNDKNSPNFDKLWRIRDYWETVYDSFLKARAPSREVSIDEEVSKNCGE